MGFSLSAANAHAYCRETTCGTSKPSADCFPEELDQHGCLVKGAPLYWPGLCVSFGVQENGSKKLGISWEVTDSLVQKAFAAWQGADCGGGRHPSLKAYDLDYDGEGHQQPIICPSIEFNQKAPNANVYLYRDDDWPYHNAANTLALTTTTFDEDGRILDVDVEINSFSGDLTTTDTNVGSDLQSILTHETGHFLGLAHSNVPGATMDTFYKHFSTNFRTLEEDDTTGICTVYPPARDAPDCKDNPTPLHGFTRYCAGEADTGTLRTGLSLDSGSGCTCSFDHSNGHVQRNYWIVVAAAGCVGARRRRKAKGNER